jgi:hypothetical protein
MKNEIESSANLIVHVMKLAKTKIPENNLETFKTTLVNLLLERYSKTKWKPNDPSSESFYRKLRICDDISPSIELAYQTADIDELMFRSSLPIYMTISPDPNTVIFQIGRNGPPCELYHSEGPDGPWESSEEYKQLFQMYHKHNPLATNLAKKVYNYLEFKSRYQPWDNRKLTLDPEPISIDGELIDEDNDFYYFDSQPDIITQNEHLGPCNFKYFKKWFIKGGSISEWQYYSKLNFSTRQCAKEYLRHINGDPPSPAFKLHSAYLEDPVSYEKLFKKIRNTPTNNAYWLTENNQW